jgi:deoxyribodipyrimidine photolyase-related protein
MGSRTILVVLGNQLFSPHHLEQFRDATVFMAEDLGLCTYVRHHQQKIVLFLAAMRSYADELRDAGFEVTYKQLEDDIDASYEDALESTLDQLGAEQLVHFEIEDRPFEKRIVEFAERKGLKRTELASPMFLTDRGEFRAFAAGRKRLLMAEYYRQQRIGSGVLVDEDNKPVGGKWSFDTDNRKKLPRTVTPPRVSPAASTEHVSEVITLVQKHFAGHPGSAADFWWPTTRKQARDWLAEFVQERLSEFGPYEDAISSRSDTVFHSLLSPMMNIGLLTPHEVLESALDYTADHDSPLPSIEGFVRQVMGWREFIRGIYHEFGEEQEAANFWGHERELTDSWYDGTTGIEPLDDAIRVSARLGWAHHIQRLMIVANLMTLSGIRPPSAWRWFMEMYVDSSDWVMGPNVFGMGIFSDGGVFATKPYICGSNYVLKMSDYRRSDWCDTMDGLYWRFIETNREFFEGNPRLALMPKALDRLQPSRKTRIYAAADSFLARNTR